MLALPRGRGSVDARKHASTFLSRARLFSPALTHGAHTMEIFSPALTHGAHAMKTWD